ncbi:uncharacterized protein LOC106664701 [Cimex lectularius]|uniref:C2H2-type domain-containing protein n=1 Tax=Cimex lectularius TaxID=79782 RepID=A0A8I6RJ90_CIMLE|nr:uncharacterized protein LOC106664701 [Cimex lectularius]
MFHHLRCKVCEDVFCCANHRRHHEHKIHKKPVIPILINRKFIQNPVLPLKFNQYEEKKSESISTARLLKKRKISFYNDTQTAKSTEVQEKTLKLRPFLHHKQVNKVSALQTVKEEEMNADHIEKTTNTKEDEKIKPNENIVLNNQVESKSGTQSSEIVGTDMKSESKTKFIQEIKSPLVDTEFTTSTPIVEQTDQSKDTCESLKEEIFATPATNFNSEVAGSSDRSVYFSSTKSFVSPLLPIDELPPAKRKISFLEQMEYVNAGHSRPFNSLTSQMSQDNQTSTPGLFSTIVDVVKNTIDKIQGRQRYAYNESWDDSKEPTWAVPCSPSGRKRIRTTTVINPRARIRGRRTYLKSYPPRTNS